MAEKEKGKEENEEKEEVQKRGEENRSPSLAELCKMQQNTVPQMVDYHLMLNYTFAVQLAHFLI